MALIHEKLYQSQDLANIDFSDYIESLAHHLFHSYTANPDLVSLSTDVNVSLDIDHAIPCGLIVNELLSNSAGNTRFPEGQTRSHIQRCTFLQADKFRVRAVVPGR